MKYFLALRYMSISVISPLLQVERREAESHCRSVSDAPSRALRNTVPRSATSRVWQSKYQSSHSRAIRKRTRRAALLDESPPWTSDQIAGLAFGVFLLLCVYFAKEIDTIVARSQRRQLGLCEECGGLFDQETCKEWRCPFKDDEGMPQ